MGTTPRDQAEDAAGTAAPKHAARQGTESRGSEVALAARAAATSPENDLPPPSEAQIEAGNFKVGRTRINGLDISIEHPAGVKRKAAHRKKLRHAYGYIRRTEGADGEKVDAFLGDRAADTTLPVFVVDQTKADGSFDEAKVMLGFDSEVDAREAYLSNYPKGWTGLGAITQMTQDEFKAWVRDPKQTKRPAYRRVKPADTVTGRSAMTRGAESGAAFREALNAGLRKATDSGRSAKSIAASLGDRERAALQRSYPAESLAGSVRAWQANNAPPSGAAQENATTPAAINSPETDSKPIDEPAAPAAAVVDALGAISEGGFAESILRGLSDADARAAAKAMGFSFSSTAKAPNIANNLAGKSQVDVREAAGRAFKKLASPEQQQALAAARPARQAAANERVAEEEQAADLRRRERNGMLMRENGEPFKNEHAANKLLRALPAAGEFAAGGFGVYNTESGWALRRWPTTGVGAIDDGFVDQETATRKRDEARAAYARDRGMEIDRFGNFVPARKAQEADGALHADPGQAAEPATPEVIAEAAATAARAPAVSMAQAREKVQAAIDAALETADTTPWPAIPGGESRQAKEAQAVANAERDRITKQAGFITIDVPGDGKFKVVNNRERLIEFRDEVGRWFKLPKAHPRPTVSSRISDAERAKVLATAEEVPDYDYNGLREGLQAVVDAEHAAGRISDAEAKAIRGRVAQAPPQALPGNDPGHGLAGESPARRGMGAESPGSGKPADLVAPETPPTGGVSASGAIEDFGERLEGARKFLPPSLKEALGDDQIATTPLSKLWPADAHESIEDPTAAAVAVTARAEIPAKPRTSYKVKRWVEQVKLLRQLPTMLEAQASLADLERVAARFGSRLDGFFAKVRLLAQLPRETW